jgi:hypothetical protein
MAVILAHRQAPRRPKSELRVCRPPEAELRTCLHKQRQRRANRHITSTPMLVERGANVSRTIGDGRAPPAVAGASQAGHR